MRSRRKSPQPWLLRSFTLIPLLASVAQAYDANELPSTATDENDSQDSMGTDNFIQKLVDKLVDQANQQFQNADMDATTLAKPGNFAAPALSQGEEAAEDAPSHQPHAFLIEDVIEPASDGTLLEEETVLPLVLGLRGGAKKAPMAKMAAMKAAPMAKMAAMKAMKAPMAKSPAKKVAMMLGLEGGMAKKGPNGENGHDEGGSNGKNGCHEGDEGSNGQESCQESCNDAGPGRRYGKKGPNGENGHDEGCPNGKNGCHEGNEGSDDQESCQESCNDAGSGRRQGNEGNEGSPHGEDGCDETKKEEGPNGGNSNSSSSSNGVYGKEEVGVFLPLSMSLCQSTLRFAPSAYQYQSVSASISNGIQSFAYDFIIVVSNVQFSFPRMFRRWLFFAQDALSHSPAYLLLLCYWWKVNGNLR